MLEKKALVTNSMLKKTKKNQATMAKIKAPITKKNSCLWKRGNCSFRIQSQGIIYFRKE